MLIGIESLDGGGKTELTKRLVGMLDFAVGTCEPNNDCEFGTLIREVLRGETNVTSDVLAQMFALNRLDHYTKVIRPLLEKGYKVVTDRHLLSSLVYQQISGVSRARIMQLNQQSPWPDITIFIDTSPRECVRRLMNRTGARPDIFEREDLMVRCRKLYYEELIIAIETNKTDVIIVNGDVGRKELANTVYRKLCNRLYQ